MNTLTTLAVVLIVALIAVAMTLPQSTSGTNDATATPTPAPTALRGSNQEPAMFYEANTEELMGFLADPEFKDREFYMFNIFAFRDKAIYKDGRETNLTGFEANQIYAGYVSPQLQRIGAEIVFQGSIQWNMGKDTPFTDVAIVRYPNSTAFEQMTSNPEFTEYSVHKEAGLEVNFMMACERLDVPFIPPLENPPYPANETNLETVMLNIYDYREKALYQEGDADADNNRTGREAADLYSTNAGPIVFTYGVRALGEFDVKAVITGEIGYELIRLNWFPSDENWNQVIADPERQSYSHHRQAGMEEKSKSFKVMPITRNEFLSGDSGGGDEAACNICGVNGVMSNPTGVVAIPGSENLECSQIEFVAGAGLFPAGQCATISSIASGPCGCTGVGPSVPGEQAACLDSNGGPFLRPFEVDPVDYPFRSCSFTTAVGSIHYFDEGPVDAQETILVVHGNPTWSFLYRNIATAMLEDGHRVVALDHLGMGMSDVPPTARFDYRPRSHAQHLEDLVLALDLNNVTLVVQDWGGPIGLGMASHQSDRISRMLIMNTWAWSVDPADPGPYHALVDWNVDAKTFASVVPNFFCSIALPGQSELTAAEVDPSLGALYERVLAAYLSPAVDPNTGEFRTAEPCAAMQIFAESIGDDDAYQGEVEGRIAALRGKPYSLLFGLADQIFGALRCDVGNDSPCPGQSTCICDEELLPARVEGGCDDPTTVEFHVCKQPDGSVIEPYADRFVDMLGTESLLERDVVREADHMIQEWAPDRVIDSLRRLLAVAANTTPQTTDPVSSPPCILCDGGSIVNGDAIVELPDGQTAPCEQLDLAARNGLLPADACSVIVDLVRTTCGCA